MPVFIGLASYRIDCILFSLWSCSELVLCDCVAGSSRADTKSTGTSQNQVLSNNALLRTELELELQLVCWRRWSNCRAAACWQWQCQCLPQGHPARQ